MVTRVRRRAAALVVLMVGSVALAQVAPPSEGGEASGPRPKIHCENTTVDLGKVKEGDLAKATFAIENRGDADLIIDNVRASCGCTIPKQLTDAEKVVKPGEKREISAEFNSKGRPGTQRKNVTVTSNDPDEPRLQLIFTAEVETLYTINPQNYVRFKTARPGEALAQPVEILPSQEGAKLEVLAVVMQTSAVTYEQEPLEKEGKSGALLRFKIGEDAPIGQLMSKADIHVRVGEESAQASLSIHGEVVGELAFRPDRIDATRKDTQTGQRLQAVTIDSPDKKPFQILGVEAGPYMTAEYNARPGESEYVVTVQIKDDAPAGPLAGTLRVLTSSYEQPVIEIPVFAVVTPTVSVQPSLVLLRSGDERGMTRRVRFETARRTPIEIIEVSADQSFIDAKVVDEGEGTNHYKMVEVSLKDGAAVGDATATLKVTTSVAGAEHMTVPIRVFAGGSAVGAAQN